MSFEWRVYSTQEHFLRYLADKHNLDLDWLGEGNGEGYVSDGKNLSVFCKGSSVDEDYMIVTLFKEDYNYE